MNTVWDAWEQRQEPPHERSDQYRKDAGGDDRPIDAKQTHVGAAAIDSIGPTEAKVTPIMTGRRMPTPGKPTHSTSVAKPQVKRSALIRTPRPREEA